MNEMILRALRNDELYHHGVIGQKWGIRRYQPYGEGYDPEHTGKFIGKKATKKYAKLDKKVYKIKKDYDAAIDQVTRRKQAKTESGKTGSAEFGAHFYEQAEAKKKAAVDKIKSFMEKYETENGKKLIKDLDEKSKDVGKYYVEMTDEEKGKVRIKEITGVYTAVDLHGSTYKMRSEQETDKIHKKNEATTNDPRKAITAKRAAVRIAGAI